MPTLLKACARVGSDAAVAGAANPELSSAAAGSRAVTAAVSSIRRDLLMARLLTAGGAAARSIAWPVRARSRFPRRWSRRGIGRDETRRAFFSKDFGFFAARQRRGRPDPCLRRQRAPP